MYKYTINHKAGFYQIAVAESESGLNAHVYDKNGMLVAVVDGQTDDGLYGNCLTWASSNISGGFEFARAQNTDFNSVTAAVA